MKSAANDRVLTESALLHQFAQLEVIVGPHGDRAVRADGSIGVGPQQVERADADVMPAVRVSGFPGPCVEREEDAERGDERVQRRAAHPGVRNGGQVIDGALVPVTATARRSVVGSNTMSASVNSSKAPRRFRGADMERVVLAEPTVRQLGYVHNRELPEAGLRLLPDFRETLQDGTRCIGRAIVDDDDLQSRVVEAKERSGRRPRSRAPRSAGGGDD